MFYKSTRDSKVNVTSAQAIAQGISVDGGLFVPSEIPSISFEDVKKLGKMKYSERAAFVFSKYLTDFTDAEITYCVDNAYNDKKFSTDNIAEIAHLFRITSYNVCYTKLLRILDLFLRFRKAADVFKHRSLVVRGAWANYQQEPVVLAGKYIFDSVQFVIPHLFKLTAYGKLIYYLRNNFV